MTIRNALRALGAAMLLASPLPLSAQNAKSDQLDAVYTLRRGLQQMPPQAAMEWMIKRIAGTQNNDALLAGL